MKWLQDRRYWVFDLDGTLTLPVHDFQHIRQALGIARDDDILDAIAAMPEPRRSGCRAQLDELELYYAGQAKAAQGLHPLLDNLKARGCRCGILTRNSREVALMSLAAIGANGYFEPEYVLGRDEARPKPDPGGLRHLLLRWGARPEQALMVGDFRYDLEAGRNAGMQTVHVDSRPERDWPDVTDVRVQSLSELHQLLQA